MPPSEEFMEKQAAEQGLISVIPDNAIAYGYQHENRHMVECFREGRMPRENWMDGLPGDPAHDGCIQVGGAVEDARLQPRRLEGLHA